MTFFLFFLLWKIKSSPKRGKRKREKREGKERGNFQSLSTRLSEKKYRKKVSRRWERIIHALKKSRANNAFEGEKIRTFPWKTIPLVMKVKISLTSYFRPELYFLLLSHIWTYVQLYSCIRRSAVLAYYKWCEANQTPTDGQQPRAHRSGCLLILWATSSLWKTWQHWPFNR